jgi:hypothetical protein
MKLFGLPSTNSVDDSLRALTDWYVVDAVETFDGAGAASGRRAVAGGALLAGFVALVGMLM